ncbi:hypothetical protein EJ03DRAFT_109753 [Teratosphaeria nubilosa]|uniref:Uncharacterized protein n=1 Tax=Teratosphaeria nubilosa TaxID=161662 RepID=A0A6G1L8Z8_9PEZI|nr:hypothetical protein EJ03DRAFT_109753 [Teratosphaeria nubilosa]
MSPLSALEYRSKRIIGRDSFQPEEEVPSSVVHKVRNEGKLAQPADWTSEAESEAYSNDLMPTTWELTPPESQLQSPRFSDREARDDASPRSSRSGHQCSCQKTAARLGLRVCSSSTRRPYPKDQKAIIFATGYRGQYRIMLRRMNRSAMYHDYRIFQKPLYHRRKRAWSLT